MPIAISTAHLKFVKRVELMLSILATPTERDTGNFWRLCYVYYLDILTASQVYAYSKYIKLYTLSIQFFSYISIILQ